MADKTHVPRQIVEESCDITEFRHVCSVKNCNKRFSRPNRLLIHLRTHTGERPFQCEEPGCNKSYCRQSHLLRHQKNAHRPATDKNKISFCCGQDGCNATFTQEHNLQKHFKRQHSSDAAYKYKCEVDGCGQTFRKHHQLRAHGFTHTNINPFTCPHPGCAHTFQTNSHLQRHLKVHQGYQCNKEGCGQVFSKWTELRLHDSKDHAEEHKCSECSKVFPKKGLLNTHYRTHHEDRSPVSCPYEDCNRMYWEKRNLREHIRRHHEGERFHCEISSCEKTFASKQRLKEHMVTHDPEYSPPLKKAKKKKHKQPRKPGKKKKSVASALSGIDDSTVSHDLDPVIVEDSACSDFTSVSASEFQKNVKVQYEEVAKSPGAELEQGIVMQTNSVMEQILKNHPVTCTDISTDIVSIGKGRTSGSNSANESMEICEVTDCSINSETEVVPLFQPSHQQEIISVPTVIAPDSGLEQASSDIVTFAVL